MSAAKRELVRRATLRNTVHLFSPEEINAADCCTWINAACGFSYQAHNLQGLLETDKHCKRCERIGGVL